MNILITLIKPLDHAGISAATFRTAAFLPLIQPEFRFTLLAAIKNFHLFSPFPSDFKWPSTHFGAIGIVHQGFPRLPESSDGI